MFKQTITSDANRWRWHVSALRLRDLVGRNEEDGVGLVAKPEFFDLGNFQTAPFRSDGSTCGATMASRALVVAGQPGMGLSPF